MKNSIKSTLCLALCLISLQARCELRDTSHVASLDYTGELGYFQKANRDLGDPVFMLYDDKLGLDFGIGGTVKVNAFFDCLGNLYGRKFSPTNISVPTDHSNTLGATVKDSELHVKARYHFGKHKVIAFLKVNGNDSNMIKIDQAYVSFDGFSIGLIPSFFSDLEVGYLTAGYNVTSPVSFTHPLVGYKRQFGNHWVFGASLEKPEVSIPQWLDSRGLSPDSQCFPDVTLHTKCRWEGGHVQLGILARNLKYWTYTPPVQYSAQGDSFYRFGYGISLTGHQQVSEKFSLSGEFVYGKGISRYMDVFNGVVSDLGVVNEKVGDNYRMDVLPVFNGLVSAQCEWSEKLTSTVIISYARSFEVGGVALPGYEWQSFDRNFNHSVYGLANLFWNISPSALAGIEALYGYSRLRNAGMLPSDYGTVLRMMFTLSFMF